MNSRIVPISTGILSFTIAAFFIFYFDGVWRWFVVSPLLILVVWPSLKIGLLSSQEEVDKLTGADKLQSSSDKESTHDADRIWGKLSQEQIEVVQRGFLQICVEEKLEQYLSTGDLPVSVLESVSRVANKISQDSGISPAFVPLAVHQYVDSDHMLRVMHRDGWVSYMTTRQTVAPQPEYYLDYLNKVYFSGKHGD